MASAPSPNTPKNTHGFTRRHWLASAGAAALAAGVPLPALTQGSDKGQFPSRAITLVVPFGAGGVADLTARTVANAMESALSQPVVVDNRPGAGGITGTSAVVRARPDGHTLLLMSNATAISATMFPQQKFDARQDLLPISALGHFDLTLCVAADSRHPNLQSVVEFAKANPGKLSIGAIAIGSTQNLTAELFKSVAGIDALIVPYNSTPDVLAALRSGEVDLAVEIVTPIIPQVKAQTLRALAVTALQRNPQLPQTPTSAEAGLRNFVVSSWNALAAPKGTPEAVVQRLNAAVHQAMSAAAVQEKLGALGIRTAAGTPAEAASLLESETRRWREVIQAAGVKPAG